MPLLHWNGISKPTPTQLYEYSKIGTPVKLALAVSLLMTLTLVALANMNQNKSSTQQRTSEDIRVLQFSTGEVKNAVIYLGADPDNCMAIRPNPPTPEMVERAQPFRADTLQEMEAIIKHPSHVIHG
jgi:hypothetical protein